MRYTIIFKDKKVWHTNWFDYENNWNPEFHFLVINNFSNQYTTNGWEWIDVEDDHL